MSSAYTASTVFVDRSKNSKPLIDERQFQALYGNDPTLLQEMAELFFRELPAAQAGLKCPSCMQDRIRLKEVAHKLKNQVAYFCAFGLRDAIEKLEQINEANASETAMNPETIWQDVSLLVDEIAQRLKVTSEFAVLTPVKPQTRA